MRDFLIFSFANQSKQTLRVKRIKNIQESRNKKFTEITNSNIIQTSFFHHTIYNNSFKTVQLFKDTKYL